MRRRLAHAATLALLEMGLALQAPAHQPASGPIPEERDVPWPAVDRVLLESIVLVRSGGHWAIAHIHWSAQG